MPLLACERSLKYLSTYEMQIKAYLPILFCLTTASVQRAIEQAATTGTKISNNGQLMPTEEAFPSVQSQSALSMPHGAYLKHFVMFCFTYCFSIL